MAVANVVSEFGDVLYETLEPAEHAPYLVAFPEGVLRVDPQCR